MGVTIIQEIHNHTDGLVQVRNLEQPDDTAAGRGDFQGGEWRALTMWIPWCTSADQFARRHITVTVNGRTVAIWQADLGGADRVRVSADGNWYNPGNEINGVSVVGPTIPNPINPFDNPNRTLIVNDSGLFLLPQVVVDALRNHHNDLAKGGYQLSAETELQLPQRGPDRKRSASAFSMAGLASDAFRAGQADACYQYRDSGKRYRFMIQNGVVFVTNPDGSTQSLTQAISYHRRRRGDVTTAPPFELVAACGGRVMAKEQGAGRFYLATLDEMFIHCTPRGLMSVPSTYFKLDPEFNQPTANVRDLLTPLAGDFANHPAAERFTVFRTLLDFGVMDAMMVRMRPGIWHLIDPRPPYSADHSPLPAWAPVYNHVEYCPTDPSLSPVWRTSIAYAGVLDIGVGHVHWHEQYARITGGELQPMRTSGTTLDALSAYVPQPYFQLFEQLFPSLANLDPTLISLISTATYPMLYQFFNGPVRDGDGYIDGTCNLYALVQLKANAVLGVPDGYALLYQDEQSYFTQRWRLVHPDDFQGLMFALVPDLHADLQREPSRQLYHWDPNAHWCPFRSGYIGAQSRLAVAAQVLVVNGEDPARITETDRTRAALIVSINFSWATMDRTWRWRRLPDNVQARYFDTSGAARGDEPIGTDVANSAYPQTLELRGDMTIVLKGTSNGQLGRWYQRYLPASNTLYPAVPAATGQLPGAGFTHAWKFVPEGVFTNADRFSHFGVYDQVDSRSQYYVVTPASATDAQTLAAGGSGPWIDDLGQLFIQYAKFPWDSLRLDWPPALPAQWPPLPASPRRPSLFNADTRLRIVQRGSRWLALPWDKRDDDLLPTDGLPKTVQLKNGARTVTVTLNTNSWLEQPPAVQSAYFWWEPSGACGVAFSAPQSPGELPFDNVWRVRMAALLDPNGDVLPLLDLTTEGRFSQTNEGAYEYRWTPGASEQFALTQYASSLAARANGTSLWFEDVVEHAGVPDQVWWGRSSGMSVSLTPATIPLGIAVPVTVHAQDARTAAPLSGAVLIDGQAVGRTDAPFTFTFNTQRNRVFDPETRTWSWGEETVPAGVVRVADYPDSAIPFAFYRPLLRTWVEPATIPIGPTVQLTVYAEDATTHAAVAGQVLIGGQVVGSTNTPFYFAFSSAGVSGVVSAGDYPNRAIIFALYMRQLHVWVEPSPLYIGRTTAVTVHATDAMTGTSVAGRVLIAGQDVGATNTTFNYTFGSSAPNAIVTAPYYDTAPISWPALRQPRLVVRIQPYPVAAGTLTTYTVRATDGDSSAAVDGSVKVNGVVVARTNVPFSYRFVMQRVRTFDPETRTYTTELVAPTASVSASGYLEANLDLGLNTT